MTTTMAKSSPRRRFLAACALTGAGSLGLSFIPFLPEHTIAGDALLFPLACTLAVLTAAGAILAVFSLKHS